MSLKTVQNTNIYMMNICLWINALAAPLYRYVSVFVRRNNSIHKQEREWTNTFSNRPVITDYRPESATHENKYQTLEILEWFLCTLLLLSMANQYTTMRNSKNKPLRFIFDDCPFAKKFPTFEQIIWYKNEWPSISRCGQNSVVIHIYNIAFVNSERWLVKSRVYITRCKHGKFPVAHPLK